MSLLSEGRDNGPYLMRLVTIGKTAKRKKKGKRKKKAAVMAIGVTVKPVFYASLAPAIPFPGHLPTSFTV